MANFTCAACTSAPATYRVGWGWTCEQCGDVDYAIKPEDAENAGPDTTMYVSPDEEFVPYPEPLDRRMEALRGLTFDNPGEANEYLDSLDLLD